MGDLQYQGEHRQQAGDNYMFLTSNHMTIACGTGIGEWHFFALHWSNLIATLQLVLVHAIDVFLGFHLVGGDRQAVVVVLGKGFCLTRCHEHTV